MGNQMLEAETWVAIAFVIFLAVLGYLKVHKMLIKGIDDRRDRIKAELDEARRLKEEAQALLAGYQRKQQESQDDFNDAQQELVNRIGRKMVEVLDKYSKENNYALVLDTSSQQTPVIYAANQIDVTQEIIRLYDQNYPVKTGAATPKPAAPKPATPTPKP